MANNYMNYQSMVADVTTGIAKLSDVCEKLKMEDKAQDLRVSSDKLKNHTFSVGIMGEFRRGKSTVINALLGEEIVPSDIVPTSATLNYVRWDSEKRAVINYKDGTTRQVPVTDLSNYITKITKESEAVAETVEDATVYYPCTFCQNGVQIVDTPGLNDDERMTAISEKIIPTFDAIIMVLTVDSPFSQSEAEFVRNKLMTSDLGRLIFVLNKIDLVREKDRLRLVQHIGEKIRESVLEKMAAVYGKDSNEYKGAVDKMGEIKIFPVSARDALDGKLENDSELLAGSGYPEFEEHLSRLLTEERGMIQLVSPVNKIINTSAEALENIKTRTEAMSIDSEKFTTIQNESMEKIKATRTEKEKHIKLLKAKGKTLYADLLPKVNDIYNTIENTIITYTENMPISAEEVKNKEAIETFADGYSKNINSEIMNTMSVSTEKLSVEISECLYRDAEDVKVFDKELKTNLADIRNEISVKSGGCGENAKITNALLDIGGMFLTGGIPGLGGIIEGYKSGGIAGAVVGGVSGYFIGTAAAGIVGSLFGLALGGIPILLAAGLAGTFGGKKIVNLIFGGRQKQDNTEVVRQQLIDKIPDVMNEIKAGTPIENWLRETCENAYDTLADDMDKEWEMNLHDMEQQLAQIKVDLEMNNANKAKLEEDMLGCRNDIESIVEKIRPIQAKLKGASAV